MLKRTRQILKSSLTRRRFLVNLGVFGTVYGIVRIQNQRKQSTASLFPQHAPENKSCYERAGAISTISKKPMITLSLDASGLLSDVTAGEEIKDGHRTIQADGRLYTAFYWINNVRWQHPDGSPRRLESVPIPAGQIIHIKKVWIDTTWVQTFDDLYIRKGESWYQNKGSDMNLIYKTITTAFTAKTRHS